MPRTPSNLAQRKRPSGPADSAVESMQDHLPQVQRLVMQGELAATAVHEISNLLTIVLFNAGLLHDRHREDPQDKRYIEPLLHAAGLITTLCSQLRNLSRPSTGRLRVIDLADTARGTFRLLEQILMRKLVFQAPTGVPVPVYADPAHIDQILVNLVLNARDATNETGQITIRVGVVPADGPTANWRCLEIEDNGAGMTPEVQRELFKMFFTTKPDGRGSGIGLVTVRHLVEGLHGRVELTSQPGHGTCLRILLPPPETVLPPDEQDQLPIPAAPDRPPGRLTSP